MIKSNTQYGKFGGNFMPHKRSTETSIDEVYNELIQLRQKNRALEGRIKQLELQNFNITKSGFNKGGVNQSKNVEPLRPVFDPNSIDQSEEDENDKDDE